MTFAGDHSPQAWEYLVVYFSLENLWGDVIACDVVKLRIILISNWNTTA